MMTRLKESCPLSLVGVELKLVDTATGAALVYTTDSGDVSELRRRVREMTKNYDAHDGRLGMIWHHMGAKDSRGRHGHRMGGWRRGLMARQGPMPALSAVYMNVDKGAQILISPRNLPELPQVREHLRQHLRHMRSGECWSTATKAVGDRALQWSPRRIDRR